MEVAHVRELAEELGTDAEVTGFAGAVEHSYFEDGVIHHEINLVFEVHINDLQPVCQEDHLECHWLRLDDLADADVRPAALRNALVGAGEDRTPFWRGWSG